jgi:hypothetical protein
LNNACDAMPNGGTVVIETSDYSDPNGEYVVVSIADTGTGIAEDKQAHIFEPFFTTKELRRGTGLGLSIAAIIVRQHQGSIELQSAPGEGTKFTIRFRISGAVSQTAPPHTQTNGVSECVANSSQNLRVCELLLGKRQDSDGKTQSSSGSEGNIRGL